MNAPGKSPLKEPLKLGSLSVSSGIIAYYSYFLNLSLGPVFWLLLLLICVVVSFGAGIIGIAISGVRLGIDASKRNDWVGLILSLSGIILTAIAVYRAIHALTNW